MQLQAEQVKVFQREILSWYKTHQRELPWRDVPYDASFQEALRGVSLDERAYHILLSEVMSQQTQLSRVIPKYREWLQELPTLTSLAEAEQSAVLRLWSGLGYNRRALFLQKAAQVIVNDYNGVWPRDEKELEKLPGIGKYTAAAVACFAFDKQIPVVDTNVRKVILTKFQISKFQFQMKKIDRETTLGDSGEIAVSQNDERDLYISDKVIEDIAWQLLPEGRAYEWNQALMDYSSLMLKQEKIPIPKQSKFPGSRRSYRGKVLKLLLQHQELSFEKLWELVQDSHSKDETWFKGIANELVEEGMVKERKGKYFL